MCNDVNFEIYKCHQQQKSLKLKVDSSQSGVLTAEDLLTTTPAERPVTRSAAQATQAAVSHTPPSDSSNLESKLFHQRFRGHFSRSSPSRI